MAAEASFLEEELCCPVCCDIFKDPVALRCSHSFCRACLKQCWDGKSSRECPMCRCKASTDEPPVSLALKNTVESYLQQRTGSEATGGGEDRCALHGKAVLSFCEDDLQPLCALCHASKNHREHQVCPIQEAMLDQEKQYNTALNPIKQKLAKFIKVKEECVKMAEFIRSQAQDAEKLLKAEFEKLHQFLRDEEEARLAALREEEAKKTQMMKKKIKNFKRHVSTLSEKITAIENIKDNEDISFLKSCSEIKERAQCKLQDPELPSGALIDVAKHLGNLKFRVWEKMLEMVQYTPLTLDPNTANSWLSLSDDLTSVRLNGSQQQIPDNPERFNSGVMLFGSEGYTSGKHSWDVEVGNKTAWTIGVAKESIDRNGRDICSSEAGFWVLMLRDGDKYRTGGGTDLTLKKKPQMIRVRLEYGREGWPSMTRATCHTSTLSKTRLPKDSSPTSTLTWMMMAVTQEPCRSAQ